jgi:hypothetical protein
LFASHKPQAGIVTVTVVTAEAKGMAAATKAAIKKCITAREMKTQMERKRKAHEISWRSLCVTVSHKGEHSADVDSQNYKSSLAGGP